MNRIHLYTMVLVLMGLVFILPSASASLILDINFDGQVDDQTSNFVTTNNGVTFSTNVYGGSGLSGNFSTDYIEITDNPILDMDNFTICWWSNPFEMTGVNVYQIYDSKWTGGGQNGTQIRFFNGRLYYTVDTGPDANNVISNTVTQNQTWEFWCARRNATAISIYHNGLYDNHAGLPAGKVEVEANPKIGQKLSGTESFVGLIDTFQIYNESLSDAAILLLNSTSSSNFVQITATDAYTSAAINTFNVTFTNGSFFSTTTGNVTLINWTNGNYTLTIDSGSYISNTTTFEHINSTSLSFTLYPNNNVAFTFFDEETEQFVRNVTYVLYSYENNYSVSGNTTNGSLQKSGLNTGLYVLRYENTQDHYRRRNHFIYIPLQSTGLYNTTLYLLNESTGDAYLPLVVDENDIPYTGVFQALRWYGNGDGTGQYRVVESSQVDAQGLAAMFLEYNTASYIFRAINIRTNTVDTQFNVPKQLFEQSEIYRVIFQVGFFTTYEGLGTLKGTNINYYNTTTEYYEYSYADKPSTITNICLQMTVVEGVNQTVTRTCGSAENGVLVISFNHTSNPGLYDVLAFANATNGVRYTLTSRQDNFIGRASYPSGTLYRNIALLAAFFIGITGAFIATATPIVGIFIMVGSIGLMGSAVLNMLPFGGAFLVSMIIVGFMIAVITKK